jgi:hypothetical protein
MYQFITLLIMTVYNLCPLNIFRGKKENKIRQRRKVLGDSNIQRSALPQNWLVSQGRVLTENPRCGEAKGQERAQAPK